MGFPDYNIFYKNNPLFHYDKTILDECFFCKKYVENIDVFSPYNFDILCT